MKLTKTEEAALMKVYDTWWDSYLKGDVETYDSFLDKDFRFVGSTGSEEFLNKKDTTAFFEATAEQLAGNAKVENVIRSIEPLEGMVLITDLADTYIKDGTDWAYYARFRFTSLLRKTNQGWRFFYQHFSTPDLMANDGETIGIDKVSAENLELRNAIKRRTAELELKNRDLEIEAALERIRGQVTAMSQSSDLLDIVVTMRAEFVMLGHEAHYFWHMMWLPDKFEKAMTSGDGIRIGTIMELPRDFHSHYEGMDEWENSDEPIKVLALETEIAVDYIDKMIRLGNFQQVDPNSPTLDDIRHIGGITFVMARTAHGEIGYSLPGVVKNPPEEDLKILERFAAVFDLAHKRFEDLRRSELQFRETQIELALEKVRARTMAMQKSEELAETAAVIFQQFNELGVSPERLNIGIVNEEERIIEFWSTEQGGKRINQLFKGSIDEPTTISKVYGAWKSGKESIVVDLSGHKLKDWLAYLTEEMGVPFKKELIHGSRYHSTSFFTKGMILMSTPEPLSEETMSLLPRFAKVFNQTYTRFSDLKKSEEQAREAQIELALERVRARTMSMQKSEELADVAGLLFKQVNEMGIKIWTTGFNIWSEDNNYYTDYITSPQGGFIQPYTIDTKQNPVLKEVSDVRKSGVEFFVQYVEGEELKKMYLTLTKFGDKKQYEIMLKDGFEFPSHQYHHFVFGSSVSLMFITYEPLPEAHDIFKRFGKVFEQTYTRFLDLKKAESQAREAQIEAALERVRSKTMAMHNSKDVEDIVVTLFDEVLKLGLDKSIRCGIGILEGTEKMKTWSANTDPNDEVALRVGLLGMDVHPMLVGLKKAWDKGEKEYSYEYTREDVKIYYKALNDEPDYPFNADLRKLHKREFHKTFFFSSGILFSFSENPISEEASRILSRFADVFGQTYRRYLDLQKAEAQAREAQTEAALEKVRSRTMAMQSSTELIEAANLLFKQVKDLGVNVWSAGYNVLSEDKTQSECWMSSEDQLQDPFPLFYTEEESFIEMGEFLKSDADFFVQELKGKAIEQHYEYMKSLPELKETFKHLVDSGLTLPTYQINHLCKFKQGYLLFITYEPSPEAHEIFKRFTAVFEQTYTRFLDLQKAEDQSKEAQISLALERVRASSMAMHKSEQLAETAQTLFEQFDLLGVVPDRMSIAIINEKKSVFEFWATDQNGKFVNHVHDFSFDEPTCIAKAYKAWKENKETCIVDLKGKELKNWIQYVKEEAKMEIDDSNFKGRRLQNFAFFSQGGLNLSSHLPISDEVRKLLQRFAKVFQQSYTRFLDLQKSEAQAREAVKHASVDRVRAEIASMRTSSDLKRITPLIWNELTTLDVPFIRCGVFIMDEEKQQVQTHLSTPDGKAIASFELSFENTEPLTELLPYWRKKEIYKDYWNKDAFVKSTKLLMERGAFKSSENFIPEHPPENLYLHFLPFAQGMLYVGSEISLTEDELSLAQNLANAFSTAYSRYEDFNKLELANKKIEKTLVDLKQTQTQLVQSEKMASLGELTAGIAHEIQNPLNFVNNFSEVSAELVDEMNEEMEEGNLDFAKEIADDLKQNLDKINHHGKRAGEIVKGMLQHSRTSSGKKEATDINALADEYLRLAYHGLRAKDKTFNSKMESQFDPDIPKLEVIPQDIGRVILNLITNAFYAVNERSKMGEENYEPKVEVITRSANDTIEILVRDNGKGMPEHVKEKVFQPFFTTKPTGQGTGLGLSLSYDIVTAHGGEINVESKEGEDLPDGKSGTEFIIILPV